MYKTDGNRKNIIVTDFIASKSWEFCRGLCNASGDEWMVMSHQNCGIEPNKISYLLRLFRYFSFSFQVFIKRKEYNSIVTYQQFYGIVFAFYCRLFHVKKVNRLIIMGFIYNEKNGFVGKFHRWLVGSAVCSTFVDKIIVYSSHEVDYYSGLFKVPKDRFIFLRLGIAENVVGGAGVYIHASLIHKPFILSVGRSNRDYPFLMDIAKDLPYSFVVLTDTLDWNRSIPDNVKVYQDVGVDEYLNILDDCELVLIPLKDRNISSGQLVMLQSMCASKPFIITDSFAANDYANDRENCIVSSKDVRELKKHIIELMENEDLRNILGSNGRQRYEEMYTLNALGYNIGIIINEKTK